MKASNMNLMPLGVKCMNFKVAVKILKRHFFFNVIIILFLPMSEHKTPKNKTMINFPDCVFQSVHYVGEVLSLSDTVMTWHRNQLTFPVAALPLYSGWRLQFGASADELWACHLTHVLLLEKYPTRQTIVFSASGRRMLQCRGEHVFPSSCWWNSF